MPPASTTPFKIRPRGRPSESASSTFTSASYNSASNTETVADGLAVGLLDPTTAGNRRAMLQLINRLRDTGVHADIDLPMIAVIGNQSAGKSSLIESISGITLPRSSGTCTRCAMECKLTHSVSAWKCLVKLHFSTDASGMPIDVEIISFGSPITDKSMVEDRIRRAQRAILNPSRSPDRYLNQDDLLDSGNEVSFSKNYVSLEISGPELTDLSFVDLPGLIASVGRGSDDGDIELVRSLVISYIEKPSCVILLTVACETDFENQGAHQIAKQYDPLGKRTVGVLTKPDRIPPGDEDDWLRILRNETEPLVNHWYCVKQPSSQDVSKGITWEEARQRENEWFSSVQPWRSLDAQHQRYLRTTNLTEKLGHILSELISKRLPKIQEELMNAIQETHKKLQALPEAPSSDPVGEVLHLLGNFTRDLERRVEGTSEEDGLLQCIRPHQEVFKIAIRRTAPYFVPWTQTETKELPEAEFLANEDGDEDLSAGEFLGESSKIYVDQVLKQAQSACTRELPDNYPFVIHSNLIKGFTQKWSSPAMVLFDEVYEILRVDIEKLVDGHFAHMGNGNAKQAILMILHDHLDEAAEKTKERIQWLLSLEENPTTLNTHYYADYKVKFISYYKAARGERDLVAKLQLGRWSQHSATARTPSHPPGHESPVDKVLGGLNALGISAQVTDIPKLLPPDPWDAALNIMASVRAYFQIAYKRFADMVPMAIDHELVRGMPRGVERAFREGLQITGLDGYERCKSMLEQPISVVSARQEIQGKLDRLHAARVELRRLM